MLHDGDGHPWQEWRTPRPSGQRLPGNVSRWNATKDLSFVALRPERVIEVSTSTWKATLPAPRHFIAGATTAPRVLHYEQLEQR